MENHYTGIGSRNTSKEILKYFEKLGRYLANRKYTLRSGGAKGADKAFEIAEKFHPYWHNLKQGARKLQARNSHQVLGWNLENPSDFIICWTKNGSGKGGTGQALRIAKHYNIPIFDCGKYDNLNDIKTNIKLFLKENTKLDI